MLQQPFSAPDVAVEVPCEVPDLRGKGSEVCPPATESRAAAWAITHHQPHHVIGILSSPWPDHRRDCTRRHYCEELWLQGTAVVHPTATQQASRQQKAKGWPQQLLPCAGRNDSSKTAAPPCSTSVSLHFQGACHPIRNYTSQVSGGCKRSTQA